LGAGLEKDLIGKIRAPLKSVGFDSKKLELVFSLSMKELKFVSPASLHASHVAFTLVA
jgi:hypothetical protein